MNRILLIARHEVRILKIEPWVVILLIFMPALVGAFFTNGVVGGAAQAIPGLAALFGYFGISSIGMAIYRDHGWGTWDRLRVSRSHPVQVVVGKLLPLAVVFLLQYVVLFGLAKLVFQMPWRGSVAGGALLVLAMVATELGLGLLLAVVCSSIMQLNTVTSLAALLLAGIGGALAPVHTLPRWAQHVAPVSPVYWAIQGFHKVIATNAGVGDVGRPIGILFGIAAAAVVLSVLRYDHEERKLFFA